MVAMKRPCFFVLFFLVCAFANQKVIALDEQSASLQEFIERGVLCKRAGVGEKGIQLLEKTAKYAGFEIVEISQLKEGALFDDYSGVLIRKSGEIKMFDLNVFAIYFEPKFHRFSVLLNISKADIINIIKSNDDKAQQINSTSRVLFANPKTIDIGVYIPAGSPFAIEVESCDETTREDIIKVCKRFESKPLTWVGCTEAQDEVMANWLIPRRPPEPESAKR